MERRLETMITGSDNNGINIEPEARTEQKEIKRSLLEPYHSLCDALGSLDKKKLVFILATVFAKSENTKQFLETEFDPDRSEEAVPTVDSLDAVHEKQLESELVERFEGIFVRSAQAIREADYAEINLTPEQVEMFASEIENFPVKNILRELSRVSNTPPALIAQNNFLGVVDLNTYDDEGAEMMIEELGLRYSISSLKEIESVRIGLHSLATNVRRQIMFLRAEDILLSGLSEEQIRWRIRDTLIHEFLHGFPHKDFTKTNGTSHLAVHIFYEGETERLANWLRTKVYEDSPAMDPVAGHATGGNEIANLVAGAVDDDQRLLNGYLLGDFQVYEQALAEATGLSLTDTLEQEGLEGNWKQNKDQNLIIVLDKLVKQLPEDAREEIIARTNLRLETGQLVSVSNVQGSGLLLMSSLAETGLANGIFHPVDQSYTLLFPNQKETQYQIPCTASYKRVTLDGYRFGNNFENMSDSERTEIANKLIEKAFSLEKHDV